MSSRPGADALQRTLTAEHAAIYVLGVLGGQVSRSAQPELYAAVSAGYTEHRARRDVLRRMISDQGATPVAAAPAYEVPERLDSAASQAALARDVERRAQTAYAWAVAHTSGAQRRWTVRALNESAARVLAFRGTPEMLPGADEYADR